MCRGHDLGSLHKTVRGQTTTYCPTFCGLQAEFSTERIVDDEREDKCIQVDALGCPNLLCCSVELLG